MERKPSLHITEENLIKVLTEIDDSFFKRGNRKVLAKQILKRGKIYSLITRNLLENTGKTAKRASKIIASDMDDAVEFSKVLLYCRRKAHHKGLQQIAPGSKDWGFIKESAFLANDFCKDFDLSRKEGYTQYCTIALTFMKKFSLAKLNSLHSAICTHYDAIRTIASDPTPKTTEELHHHYTKLLAENTSIVTTFSQIPTKYIFFIHCAEACRRFSVSPYHYIKAQFEGLEWASAVPDTAQLVGPKAEERLVKYLAKHKEEIENESSKLPGINFKMIRDDKDNSK